MPSKLGLWFSTSLGERTRAGLPKAHVDKTIDVIINRGMMNPRFEEWEPDMRLGGKDLLPSDVLRSKVLCVVLRHPVVKYDGSWFTGFGNDVKQGITTELGDED